MGTVHLHSVYFYTFDCLYPHALVGVGGYDGNGDITNPDNLEAFQDYVLEQTDGRGVHFVMADGVSEHYAHTHTHTHTLPLIRTCRAFQLKVKKTSRRF